MVKHKKIYLDYFGLTEADHVNCEMCGATATDIHHIDARGMGGSATRNMIQNLMALCRTCHIIYGDKTKYKDKLKKIHEIKMLCRK